MGCSQSSAAVSSADNVSLYRNMLAAGASDEEVLDEMRKNRFDMRLSSIVFLEGSNSFSTTTKNTEPIWESTARR